MLRRFISKRTGNTIHHREDSHSEKCQGRRRHYDVYSRRHQNDGNVYRRLWWSSEAWFFISNS